MQSTMTKVKNAPIQHLHNSVDDNHINIQLDGKHNFEGLTLKDVIPNRRKPFWRDLRLIKLNTLLLCGLLTLVTQGFDGSMLNGMQALPQWKNYFGEPKGARLGAMTFGVTGGSLISVLVSAQLCDRFGRRYPICGGSLVIIIGVILQAAAVNYGMFVAARFIIGFGSGIVSVAGPPLLSEAAYPSHRGKLVSFYLGLYQLGALIAAWTTYGTFNMVGSSWSWRIPSLLQCVFPIIQGVLSLVAPESPRWLIYQGRTKEAFNILVKYHGDGNANSELVQFEMAEITATLQTERIQRKSRWQEFVSSKGNQHRLFLAIYIPAMLQLSGNGLTSYFLPIVLNSVGITNSTTQLIINACISVFSFIIACFCASIVDKAGRRRLFLISMSGMGISYVIWTICSAINEEKNFKDKGYGTAVLAMIFLYNGCYQICAPIAPTYVMEVVPYSLRSKTAMLYMLVTGLGLTFNSFANPIIMDKITWRYYIVWCVVIAINLMFIILFFPETKGYSLEEVAEIFDGPGSLSGMNALRQAGFEVDVDNAQLFKKDQEAGTTGKKATVEQVETI